MKPIRNATLGLAVALFATVGFVGCSGSAQNQPGSNFAQGSGSTPASASSSSSSGRDFTGGRSSRPASQSDSSYGSQSAGDSSSQPAPQPATITIPRGTELRVSVDRDDFERQRAVG